MRWNGPSEWPSGSWDQADPQGGDWQADQDHVAGPGAGGAVDWQVSGWDQVQDPQQQHQQQRQQGDGQPDQDPPADPGTPWGAVYGQSDPWAWGRWEAGRSSDPTTTGSTAASIGQGDADPAWSDWTSTISTGGGRDEA